MIRPILALLLLTPSAFGSAFASAAERRVGLGSFDRLRVEGPFDVRVATGRSPGGAIGGERDAIDAIDVRLDGTTLVVRSGGGAWGERPRGDADTPPIITLTTPALMSAAVVGGARVAIGRMKGPRVDLSVSGTGTIALTTVDADQLNATLIGSGTMSIGGRAQRARLVTNGPGTIDAVALEAGDLIVRLDGLGATRARARYTAQVTNTGLGTVVIDGNARCTVKALAGGPVTCGPKL